MKAAAKTSLREQAAEIQSQMGEAWLPRIYRERILKTRTRSYHFGQLPRSPRVEIHHTLLGVEVQIGRRRFLCPDLATARYLSVFARARCEDVAIPYDITQVSYFADELESSWQRTFLVMEHNFANNPERARIGGLLIAKLRAEIAEAGAGAAIPEFKQSTRQRK
ncbi:MAG TPA: hypothetical protein VN643_11855 [Pyrinomonadaceae bacterium]|nr:hypothetical protein [Pyrinomonadaceae bacterium]